jgi:hypothetical protein
LGYLNRLSWLLDPRAVIQGILDESSKDMLRQGFRRQVFVKISVSGQLVSKPVGISQSA